MNELAIEVRNLNFSYPDKTQALKNINFILNRGETLGLIGPNGAGKSTLILHLNGVLRGIGLVRVMGEEVNKQNIRRIRSRVGMVFQDPNDQLFLPTIFDDIAFGPLNFGLPVPEVEKRVSKILKETDLDEVKHKSSLQLSLGEKKKVALATVMVMEPEILVLDEPSSSLDPGSRRTFIRMLGQIPVSKIIATHDLDLVAELCSRVVLMDAGEIIAQGETGKILSNKNLLEQHRLEIPASLLLQNK